MGYFNKYPKTKFLNQSIVNLTTAIKLNDLVKDDVHGMMVYEIQEGEAPDHVAFNYYDDQSYAWLVLLSNQIIDPYFQWPLSVYDFDQWIKKKYGSIATAQATTIHCEHKTKNLTVAPDSLTVSNGVSSSDYDAIDAYTYWDRINENRRHIKLINRNFIPQIDNQFTNIMAAKQS